MGEALISAVSGLLYSSFSANSYTKCAPNLTPPVKVICLYLAHSNTALRSLIYSRLGMLALSSPKLHPNYATSHNAVTRHLTHIHNHMPYAVNRRPRGGRNDSAVLFCPFCPFCPRVQAKSRPQLGVLPTVDALYI